MPAERPIKIMLSSTVYHFKNEIEQIYGVLTGFGYEVLCSHIGNLYALGKPPIGACIEAVEECDIFLGIITPFYGSGITHEEILHAIKINKPRIFMNHAHVTFARQILKPFMYGADKKRNDFKIPKSAAMDDIRVVDMYNDAIGADKEHLVEKLWSQEYYNFAKDGMPFILKQFSDVERVREDLKKLKDGK